MKTKTKLSELGFSVIHCQLTTVTAVTPLEYIHLAVSASIMTSHKDGLYLQKIQGCPEKNAVDIAVVLTLCLQNCSSQRAAMLRKKYM